MKTPNLLRSRSRLWLLSFAVGMAWSNLTVAHAATEPNLKKFFTVTPGGQLIVDVDRGSIDLSTGDVSDLEVEVIRIVTGKSVAKTEEILAAHEITFAQDGNKVEVHAKMKKDFNGLFNVGGLNLNVQYKISIPKKFNLDLKTAAGSVTVGDLVGELKARTAGGSLKFGNIEGPVNGNTSAGSIHLASANGPVAVKTAGGSIDLGKVEADTVAETSAGSITVKVAKAKLVVKSAGGSINLGELDGETMAETSAGSIEVKKSKAKLVAKSSGGSLSIDDALEAVDARTSAGSVTASFSAQPTSDCRLSTAGGSVRVKVAANLAFDVDAKTNGGQVKTDLPIDDGGGKNKSSLQGKLNGGGKALILKTSAGGISLNKL